MQRSIRICFYSTDDATGELIREPLAKMPHLKLVGEASCEEEVRGHLGEGSVDLILVNLDPDLSEALEIIQTISRRSPDVGVIGVSQRTDPTTIIQAMRAGCNQFVTSPIEIEDLRAAIQRVEATHMSNAHASRRICLVGSTGGVGTTTIACNLARELADLTDRPCALVDLNLEFGDVTGAFDCKPQYSLADVCRIGCEIDRTMAEAAVHELPCNVHILARPDNIAEAHEIAPENVERLLELLAGVYPHVVVDLPRSFNFFTSTAVDRADLVLIVAELSVPSIRNTRRVYDLLRQVGAPEQNIEIVLNRHKAEHERITAEDVERHFARPIFATIPNDYQRVKAALDLGHPILTHAPNSPARLAIQRMAKKFAHGDADGADTPKRKRLLSRLWSRSPVTS